MIEKKKLFARIFQIFFFNVRIRRKHVQS